MKKISVILLLGFFVSCNIANASFLENKTQFVQDDLDIPLAPNLAKINDDEVGFDSAAGSISALTFKSKNDLAIVQEFYIKNLPQLGWIQAKSAKKDILKFTRDKEKLEIEFDSKKKLVKFFIESASK